jgi:hypothetical protein
MGTASLVLMANKQRSAPSHRSGDPSAFFSLAQTVCAPLRLIDPCDRSSGLATARSIGRMGWVIGSGVHLSLAVTGYGNEEAMVRSRAVGFDHHVVKPFDPHSLPDLLVVRPRR